LVKVCYLNLTLASVGKTINFGIVPLSLRIHQTGKLEQGDVLNIEGLRAAIENNDLVTATVKERY
jgi:hypothetical protein